MAVLTPDQFPVVRNERTGAEPGEVLFEGNHARGTVSPPPRTSFQEKLAAVAARDAGPEPEPGPTGRPLRLPGTDPKALF